MRRGTIIAAALAALLTAGVASGSITIGDSSCTTGLTKTIYDAWIADANSGFSSPLSAAQKTYICSQVYQFVYGIATAHNLDSGGGVTSVTASAPLASSGGTTPNLTHNTSGVAASTYNWASITVDVTGHVTGAAANSAPVASVGGSSPISSSGGTTPTISHGNSGVGAGSYTYASFTVDSMGHLSAASSGTAPVTSVSGSSPISSSGGTTPTISLGTTGSAGTYGYPTSLTTDSYGRLSSVTAGTAPFSGHDAALASDGSAVSPGGCTEYSNYGSWSVTTTARDYVLETMIDFVPSNAADTVAVGVLVDGSSYRSYEGRYRFEAAQLGSRIRISFHTRLTLSAASHEFKVCWGTLSSGYVETDAYCYRSFTLWSI